jgi:hypothetical protein
MIRKFVGLSILGALLAPRLASAEPTMTTTDTNSDPLQIAGFDPDQATAPISTVQGAGVKVGEGTLIHPVFGLETGFVSNVFYEHTDTQAAGLARILAQVSTATLNKERTDAYSGGLGGGASGPESHDDGDLQYDVSARASYDQLISGDQAVRATGGVGLGLQARAITSSVNAFSFGFLEDFNRLIRAANYETTTNDTRDLNTLSLRLVYNTQRTIGGYAYFKNTLDIFESDPDYPDRSQSKLGIHPTFRWLPQTLIYLDLSMGIDSGVGSSTASQAKVESYPLIALVGLASLLSLKTTFLLEAGYTNGFYSTGPSYSAPLLNLALAYRYSPLGRVGATVKYELADSINANFYRDYEAGAFIQQGFAPFVVVAQAQMHLREYEGLAFEGMPLAGGAARNDVIFEVVGGIRYSFRNWIAVTLDYSFSTVQTDFRYTDATGKTVDPSYVRHELLAGMRIAM